MRQRGEVIGEKGQKVLVQLQNPGSACGNCTGCIRLTGDERPKDHVLLLDNRLHVAVGDTVIVEHSVKALFQTVLILYGIPLAGLILGYVVTLAFVGVDATAGLGSLFGLLLGVTAARPIARRAANTVQQPRIAARAC